MNLLHWRHKNLILFTLSLVIAFLFSQSQFFRHLLGNLGNFGYFGAFMGGIFFASTFTIPSGALILVTLAKSLSLPFLIIFAGLGAVTFDFLTFKFIKKNLAEEIKPIYEQIEGDNHFKKILHTKYFGWTLPVVGGLIIASPLPDELAVSLMGVGQMSTGRFLLVSILSHTIGISLLVSASLIF